MSFYIWALVVSWPFHPARYLIPLVPGIYFFLFQGVQAAEVHLSNLMTSETQRRFYVIWSESHLPLLSCCMLDGSPTIYSVRRWRRLELGSENDCLQAGKVFQKRLSGFGVILTIKQSLPRFTIQCTTCIRVEEQSGLAFTSRKPIFIHMAKPCLI